jgi:hypothetical protein
VPSTHNVWDGICNHGEDNYGSNELTRRCLSEAVAEKAARGNLIEEHALRIGRQILRVNALELFPQLKERLWKHKSKLKRHAKSQPRKITARLHPAAGLLSLHEDQARRSVEIHIRTESQLTGPQSSACSAHWCRSRQSVFRNDCYSICRVSYESRERGPDDQAARSTRVVRRPSLARQASLDFHGAGPLVFVGD